MSIHHLAALGGPNVHVSATVGGGGDLSSGFYVVTGAIALGVGYIAYQSWKKEEARKDRMTPAERHQYDMDQLKQSVAHSLLSKF